MGDAELSKKDQARLAELEKDRFDYFVSLGRMSVGAATAKSKVVARKMLDAEKKEAANEPVEAPVEVGPAPGPVKRRAPRRKK